MTSNTKNGRKFTKDDIQALAGLWAQVDVRDDTTGETRMEQGFIVSAGHGAFGGLFVEFSHNDTSIGWNPDDTVSLYITDGVIPKD